MVKIVVKIIQVANEVSNNLLWPCEVIRIPHCGKIVFLMVWIVIALYRCGRNPHPLQPHKTRLKLKPWKYKHLMERMHHATTFSNSITPRNMLHHSVGKTGRRGEEEWTKCIINGQGGFALHVLQHSKWHSSSQTDAKPWTMHTICWVQSEGWAYGQVIWTCYVMY